MSANAESMGIAKYPSAETGERGVAERRDRVGGRQRRFNPSSPVHFTRIYRYIYLASCSGKPRPILDTSVVAAYPTRLAGHRRSGE